MALRPALWHNGGVQENPSIIAVIDATTQSTLFPNETNKPASHPIPIYQ